MMHYLFGSSVSHKNPDEVTLGGSSSGKKSRTKSMDHSRGKDKSLHNSSHSTDSTHSRQSRLGKPYEETGYLSSDEKKIILEKHTPHHTPGQSDPAPAMKPVPRTSRLGKSYEEPHDPDPTSYESIDDENNPMINFLMSCVTCDDAVDENAPTMVASKETE